MATRYYPTVALENPQVNEAGAPMVYWKREPYPGPYGSTKVRILRVFTDGTVSKSQFTVKEVELLVKYGDLIEVWA